MISKDKQYRTRDGREVRIYATDGVEYHGIHGAVLGPLRWVARSWTPTGRFYDNLEQHNDLIEVKPRFRIERWVNVYPQTEGYLYDTKEEALKARYWNCLATKRIIIEGTEGEDDSETGQ